jgi:hypothetical protein
MSQYFIRVDDETEAMVGWDEMLGTFYGQVYKIDQEGERVEEDEDGNDIVLFVGAKHNEIRTVDELIKKLAKLKPSVRIPHDICNELFTCEVD